MSDTIGTNVSPTQRAISVLLDSGKTERYALAQTREGDVFWRHDTFAADAGAPSGTAWVGHGGRLTVGQVLARVPSCERHVVRWTREEIELGVELPDADMFVRAVRSDALRRLSRELDAAFPAAA
jgi:hypothetical protein